MQPEVTGHGPSDTEDRENRVIYLKMENKTLYELLDSSIQSPQRDQVNFSSLYALLRAMLQRMDSPRGTCIQADEDGVSEERVDPSLRPSHTPAASPRSSLESENPQKEDSDVLPGANAPSASAGCLPLSPPVTDHVPSSLPLSPESCVEMVMSSRTFSKLMERDIHTQNITHQLRQQGALIERLMSDRQKLYSLEDMVLKWTISGAAPRSEDEDVKVCQQISALRRSVERLEDHMRQLEAQQALREKITADQQLQDQEHVNPPREDPPGEDPPHEDPPHEDPPCEEPPHEDPPHEDPPREDPPREDPPREDPPREDPPREDPPREDPSHEDPTCEDPPREDPPHEDPPREDPPRVNPSHEDPPREDPSHEDPPREDPPHEDPPHEDPPREDPSCVNPPCEDAPTPPKPSHTPADPGSVSGPGLSVAINAQSVSGAPLASLGPQQKGHPKADLTPAASLASLNSSGLESCSETAMSLRNVSKLMERVRKLETLVGSLKEGKADQTQLRQLRDIVSKEVDASKNTTEQLKQQGSLIERQKDLELVNKLEKAILQLQAECEKLNETTRGLQEDIVQEQSHIQELYRTTEDLEESKAGKEMLESKTKCDKYSLDSKVDRLQFDSVTEELNALFHELLNKVSDQGQIIERLSSETKCKLNRMEFDTLNKHLEERLSWIHKKLQDQKAPESDNAAVLRKPLLDTFHCLSCDRPIVKNFSGPNCGPSAQRDHSCPPVSRSCGGKSTLTTSTMLFSEQKKMRDQRARAQKSLPQ